jgi:hypothetical protein
MAPGGGALAAAARLEADSHHPTTLILYSATALLTLPMRPAGWLDGGMGAGGLDQPNPTRRTTGVREGGRKRGGGWPPKGCSWSSLDVAVPYSTRLCEPVCGSPWPLTGPPTHLAPNHPGRNRCSSLGPERPLPPEPPYSAALSDPFAPSPRPLRIHRRRFHAKKKKKKKKTDFFTVW